MTLVGEQGGSRNTCLQQTASQFIFHERGLQFLFHYTQQVCAMHEIILWAMVYFKGLKGTSKSNSFFYWWCMLHFYLVLMKYCIFVVLLTTSHFISYKNLWNIHWQNLMRSSDALEMEIWEQKLWTFQRDTKKESERRALHKEEQVGNGLSLSTDHHCLKDADPVPAWHKPWTLDPDGIRNTLPMSCASGSSLLLLV